MNDFNRTGLTVERSQRRRSAGSRFGDLGGRLSRTFGGVDRTKPEVPVWDTPEHDYEDQGDTMAWTSGAQRFPSAVHGYDPDAVDEHLDSLERELDELRAQRTERTSITAEFDRIGDQTASILRTAYEQAKEITREAKAQADKCMQDAADNALSITEDANKRQRQLDVDTDAIWHERNRLIEDARAVAAELLSLAEGATDRFPAEPDKAQRPSPAAHAPARKDPDLKPAAAGPEPKSHGGSLPRPFGVTRSADDPASPSSSPNASAPPNASFRPPTY